MNGYNNFKDVTGFKTPKQILPRYADVENKYYKYNGKVVKYNQYKYKYEPSQIESYDNYSTFEKINVEYPKISKLDKFIRPNQCNAPKVSKPKYVSENDDDMYTNYKYVDYKYIPYKFYLPDMSGPIYPKASNN